MTSENRPSIDSLVPRELARERSNWGVPFVVFGIAALFGVPALVFLTGELHQEALPSQAAAPEILAAPRKISSTEDLYPHGGQLMSALVEHIDDSNFEREVLGSELPFLLDFSAGWCAPCKALNPIIASVAEEFHGKLRVGKIDLDEAPEVAARLGVRGAPTLVLFRDGKEQARHLGMTSKPKLVRWASL
jgi:thioredoxin 1